MMSNVIAGADSDDVMGPEGMEKFCEDIGVEPENVSTHSMSNHILADKMERILPYALSDNAIMNNSAKLVFNCHLTSCDTETEHFHHISHLNEPVS